MPLVEVCATALVLTHAAVMGEGWGIDCDFWPTTWRTR
ncbi:hypothetical protein BH10PSE2_BH10PSE2_01480 [soil metagenome]